MSGGRVFGPGERDEPPRQVCAPCKLYQHDMCTGHPPCECPSWDHPRARLRQTLSDGRAYCGCCRTERAAHEVDAGTCRDCSDECFYRTDGKCVRQRGERHDT